MKTPQSDTELLSINCQVWYLEGHGSEALMALKQLAKSLLEYSSCIRTEWQSSPTQPDLVLLVSWWQGRPPLLTLPAGIKGWVFEVVSPEES